MWIMATLWKGVCPQALSICRGSSVCCPGLKECYFASKEKEQVRVVKEDDSGKKDVIYCDHPVDLIVTLLKKLGGTASVNQLCQVTNDADYRVSISCGCCLSLPVELRYRSHILCCNLIMLVVVVTSMLSSFLNN